MVDTVIDERNIMPLDYAAIQGRRRAQKSALTRAVHTKDPDKVIAVCRTVVAQWRLDGAWPDDWSNWQRALDDVLPWNQRMDLADL